MSDSWSRIDDSELMKLKLANSSLEKTREVLKKLQKDHADLQQRYNELLEENLKLVKFDDDKTELLKLAVPAIETLLLLIPNNQPSDQQKSAIGAIASLKMLI